MKEREDSWLLHLLSSAFLNYHFNRSVSQRQLQLLNSKVENENYLMAIIYITKKRWLPLSLLSASGVLA